MFALDNVRSIGTYSRYARFCKSPDPLTAESEFVAFLLRMGAKFSDRPVLFPTNDHWAIAISRHKAELARYYRPCVADFSVVELLIEKQRFYDWALSRGYPVPQSWHALEPDAVPDWAFPLVAKPIARRRPSDDHRNADRARAMDRMRLTIIRHKEGLQKFAEKNQRKLSEFVLQQYVEGLSDCMYTVGVYADRGHDVKAMFTGRKVRGFPPDIGDCVVGQNEPVPEPLKKLVREICKELKYEGIAEFEFKRDSITGTFKLIEINPRSWSWIGITPACGVSLPWVAYQDMNESPCLGYIESTLEAGSVKYVKLLEDLPNCLVRNQRAGYSEWHFSLLRWWRSLRAKKIVFADFSLDDPVPSFRALADFLRRSVGRNRRERGGGQQS